MQNLGSNAYYGHGDVNMVNAALYLMSRTRTDGILFPRWCMNRDQHKKYLKNRTQKHLANRMQK